MADRRLAVEIDGLRVAHIEARRWNDLRCRYTQDAFDRWQQNTPLLSCSLPLAPGPLEATAFCRGLVAEGRALDAMASRAGLATNDTFGLLTRYGRDVAGAISLVPAGEEPQRSASTEPYDDQQLTQAVANLDDNPLGIEDDSELSLAGLQSKLLLVKAGLGWARPVGGAASTHILKVDDPRFPSDRSRTRLPRTGCRLRHHGSGEQARTGRLPALPDRHPLRPHPRPRCPADPPGGHLPGARRRPVRRAWASQIRERRRTVLRSGCRASRPVRG